MIASVAFGFISRREEDTEVRLNHRRLRDGTNVLEYPEEQFLSNFRVNKEIFLMLLRELEPRMKKNKRSNSISAIIKLSTFLKFVATGGYQFCIGNECVAYMSKSKVSEVISELLDLFEDHICSKWISLNKTLEEENETKEAFFNKAGIPGVVGCVDGTHVRIKSPGQQHQHLYYNRKGFYSINVMAICDHNMVINYVDARHPGANHDAFVWEQSAAHNYFKTSYSKGKRNTWLLGDSGYKLQTFMMTPYRNPTEASAKRFNEKHTQIRNIIERCFGVLKNRFRCIIGSRGLHYDTAKVTKIINSCCALHNICIFFKNNWPLYEIVSQDTNEEYPSESQALELAALSVRDQIARNLI